MHCSGPLPLLMTFWAWLLSGLRCFLESNLYFRFGGYCCLLILLKVEFVPVCSLHFPCCFAGFPGKEGENSDASGQQVQIKLLILKNLMFSLFKTLLRIYISSLLSSWRWKDNYAFGIITSQGSVNFCLYSWTKLVFFPFNTKHFLLSYLDIIYNKAYF